MAINAETIKNARDAGWSNDEIEKYITSSTQYKTAIDSGYDQSEIFSFLGFQEPPTPEPPQPEPKSNYPQFISGPEAQKRILLEPFRLGKEIVHGAKDAGLKAYTGLTTSLPALAGTIAGGGSLDQSLNVAKTATEDKLSELRNKYNPPSTGRQSLTADAMDATIGRGIEAGEKATGNTGFIRSGAEFLGDASLLYGTGKGLETAGKAMSAEAVLKRAAKNLPKVKKDMQQLTVDLVQPTAAMLKKKGGISNLSENTYNAVSGLIDDFKTKSIEFIDDNGAVVNDRLPKTYGELSSAQEFKLKKLGEQIGELTKGKEVTVDIKPVINVLDELIESGSNYRFAPDIVSNAERMKARIIEKGTKITPEELQTDISLLNHQKFGRQVNADAPNNPILAARIVDELNKIQEKMINELSGDSVKAVKRDYASIKAIQDMIDNQYNLQMRKATGKKSFNFKETLALHQFLKGDILSGSVLEGTNLWNKAARRPNARIGRIFKKAAKRKELERILGKEETPVVPTEPPVEQGPAMVRDPSTGGTMRADALANRRRTVIPESERPTLAPRMVRDPSTGGMMRADALRNMKRSPMTADMAPLIEKYLDKSTGTMQSKAPPLKPGVVYKGYTYLGGDPKLPSSWGK